MQNVRKHTIVIASVLKPVDDTRGYEKLGATLVSSGLYNVHMIGTGSARDRPVPDCLFHSLGTLQRISLKRWLSSFRVLKIVRRLRPDVFVVATHELLWVAVVVKLLQGSRIVYDVQENYFRNILYTNAFPSMMKWPLALWVRAKEMTTSPFIDKFFLAEKVYKEQLRFAQEKSIIIENKAIVPPGFDRNPGNKLDLLFTGTLAESTGVFEAILLAVKLHEADAKVRLHIIGYSADKATRTRLMKEAEKGQSFITITSSDEQQPHSSIMNAISKANFGIVSYPPSLHTSGAVPTKVYEYLACQLPVLTTSQWSPLFEKYGAAVIFDNYTSAVKLLDEMGSVQGYSMIPSGASWGEEGDRLLEEVGKLIEKSST